MSAQRFFVVRMIMAIMMRFDQIPCQSIFLNKAGSSGDFGFELNIVGPLSFVFLETQFAITICPNSKTVEKYKE
jgi:hypothetical protein